MSTQADDLNVICTKCLKHHPEGHAVYENLSTRELSPGMCGYVDENGPWNRMALLTDETEMRMLGLDFPAQVSSTVDEGIQKWLHPKTSSNIHGSKAEIELRGK